MWNQVNWHSFLSIWTLRHCRGAFCSSPQVCAGSPLFCVPALPLLRYPQRGARPQVLPLITLSGKQSSAEDCFEVSTLVAQHDLIIRAFTLSLDVNSSRNSMRERQQVPLSYLPVWIKFRVYKKHRQCRAQLRGVTFLTASNLRPGRWLKNGSHTEESHEYPAFYSWVSSHIYSPPLSILLCIVN